MLLCLGATWPRDLPITNRHLDGIHFAMAFLETWQKKQMGNKIDVTPLSAKDKDVIVIGGGDTGCDCIGTSLRQVSKLVMLTQGNRQLPQCNTMGFDYFFIYQGKGQKYFYFVQNFEHL